MEVSDQSVETSDHPAAPIMPEKSTSEDIVAEIEDENENGEGLGYQWLFVLLIAWILPVAPLDPDVVGVSSIFDMLFDPLFLYVPLINEEIKCVKVDNKVKNAALVLRSISDLRYLVIMIARIKDGRRKSQSLQKIAKSVAVDIVSLLPIPQVVVLVFLPNMRGSSSLKIMKFLNSLIVLQYLARVYPLFKLNKSANEVIQGVKNSTMKKEKQYMIIVNFFAFLLASHVLGAFWYHFSIQRELDCWGYAGRSEYGSKFSTSCDESALINATLIHNLCPITPPDASKFDFGIFLYALQSGLQGSTNFPQKFFQCFSWGLRNLSSFASNLNTSTYGWENLFVVVICISGLILFMYLLGHVQTYMQGTNTLECIRWKMEEIIEPKIQLMLSEYGLPKEMKSKVKRVVKKKLEDDEDLIIENMYSILSSDVSEGNKAKNLAMEIKCSLFMDKLKKVEGLKDKGEEVWKQLCEHIEPMIYSNGCYIIREGEPLDMMFFVTAGSVLTYTTTNGGSNGSSGTIQLKKEKDDLYGDELLTWAEGPCELFDLPISAITVKCHNKLNKVEIFALHATDLQLIVSKFPVQFNMDKTLTIAVDGQ